MPSFLSHTVLSAPRPGPCNTVHRRYVLDDVRRRSHFAMLGRPDCLHLVTHPAALPHDTKRGSPLEYKPSAIRGLNWRVINTAFVCSHGLCCCSHGSLAAKLCGIIIAASVKPRFVPLAKLGPRPPIVRRPLTTADLDAAQPPLANGLLI